MDFISRVYKGGKETVLLSPNRIDGPEVSTLNFPVGTWGMYGGQGTADPEVVYDIVHNTYF